MGKVWKEVFCVTFENMSSWFGLWNYGGFCDDFGNLLFERSKLKSFSRFLNSISDILMSKDLFKITKIIKAPNL